MNQKIVIVMDCGATNVRSIAVNEKGELLAQKSFSNNTAADPYYNKGIIWDVVEIWDKLVRATQEVVSKIDKNNIVGVTITSFGVDFAPMSDSGELLYPVVSWACPRTEPIMDNIGKYLSMEELYKINGINQFSFNTINKLIWFNENKPEILEKADNFVFIPSIFIQKLCGEFVTDVTMAGTSQLTDINTRNFSDHIFSSIKVENKFPKMVQPGDVVGHITEAAEKTTGIPKGVPVIATGHDTQFAIFGSGAKEDQPVLSSGTWEILMARTKHINTGKDELSAGITNELDAIPGIYNPGLQWLGSGVLEKIKKIYYKLESDVLKDDDLYELMISDAEKATSKIEFNENIIENPADLYDVDRGQIYRSALEYMAKKTKNSLKILESSGNFKAEKLLVVGGGSKNKLWNKLRINACGIPVHVIEQKETTVFGAAMFCFYGAGVYSSPHEARKNMNNA